MTDWTTARVVRDRDGELWGRDGSSAFWDYVGTCGYSGGSPASLVAADGDPTPVLAADGLPVVRTVGDLTARHVGRTVTVEGHTGELYEVMHRGGMTAIVMSDETDHDLAGPAWFPAFGIDTPCELLPEGDA